MKKAFRIIDMQATGQHICQIMEEQGTSVRKLQAFFGFDSPNAIYKWIHGESLPSLDNLYALAGYFRMTVDEILIPMEEKKKPYTIDR